MGLLSWTIIGMLIGWFSNQINKSPLKSIQYERLLAGLAGGLTGGLLTNVFYPPGGLHIDFRWQSTLFSLVGALFMVLVYFLIYRRQPRRNYY